MDGDHELIQTCGVVILLHTCCLLVPIRTAFVLYNISGHFAVTGIILDSNLQYFAVVKMSSYFTVCLGQTTQSLQLVIQCVPHLSDQFR